MLLLYTVQSLYRVILSVNYKEVFDEQIKVNEFIFNSNITLFM